MDSFCKIDKLLDKINQRITIDKCEEREIRDNRRHNLID